MTDKFKGWYPDYIENEKEREPILKLAKMMTCLLYTSTILFSFPNKILKIVTNEKQNAIVTAIFTKYSSI